MAEVICGGTERKEPDSVTAGSSPLPALSQDSCHKLRGGSWRKGGKAQTIKACCFFFFKENIGILLCQWKQSPKREMLMQAKECVTLRRGYHPESVQSC